MSAAAESLQEFLEVEPEGVEHEHFQIDDLGQAEWAMRKLAGIRAKQNVNRELADEEIRKVALWLDQVNGTLEQSAKYFEGLLTDFHRRTLATDEKAKTVSLPAGVLKARKRPDTVNVTDIDVFKDWAEGNNRLELLRIKVEADKRALLDAVRQGEVIPAVAVVEGDVAFTVEPSL